jgi:hypothetical protein
MGGFTSALVPTPSPILDADIGVIGSSFMALSSVRENMTAIKFQKNKYLRKQFMSKSENESIIPCVTADRVWIDE